MAIDEKPQANRVTVLAHEADLIASGISREAWEAAGLYTVDDPKKVSDLLGWDKAAKRLGPCLAFPYPTIDGKPRLSIDGKPYEYVRLKPRSPRHSKDGKAIKYEAPKGRPPCIYWPPLVRETHASATYLILTEGEKKALAGCLQGFPVIGLSGVWSWKSKDTPILPELAAIVRPGLTIFICFDSDRSTNENIRVAENYLAGALRELGAVVRVVELPPGPDGAKTGLDDFFVRGGKDEEFRDLMNAATEPRDPNAGKPKSKNGRAVIILGTDEFRANDEAIAAMAKDEELYSRAGQLVRIVHDPETEWLGVDYPAGPRIAATSASTMRERLTTVADFYTVKTTDEGWEYCSNPPPQSMTNAILDRGTWAGIRRLTTLIEFPVIMPDGSILATPGYHRQSGLLYVPRVQTELSVPDRPTLADAKKAITRLCEVVKDFPFAAIHHKAAWVAGVLTPLARYAFRGCSPLFLLEGNVPGCGKGLAADAGSIIVQGEKLAVTTLPEKTEEFRKRVTSILIRGVPMALFDNVSGDFGFPELDALLTSHIWQDRLLGESTVIDLPCLTTWYATGNNVAVVGDTARRVCPIRLESPHERPEERNDMAHADLRGWVKAERPQLLSDALTILRGYILAGKPSMKLPQWGSFENWSDLIRNAIVWAGMADPWLGRADMRERTGDDRLSAISGLMRGWKTIDPGLAGLSCAGIVAAIDYLPSGHGLQEILLTLAGAKVESGKGDKRATALGYRMRPYTDRVIGGRRIVQSGINAGTRKWVVAGGDGGDGVDSYNPKDFQKCSEIFLEENLDPEGAENIDTIATIATNPSGWNYSRADLGGIM